MHKISETSGPKIFLKRLIDTGIDMSDIELLNPDLNSIRSRQSSNKILIGRLDGTSYYDFSIKNLQNFLILREYPVISKMLCKLPNLKSNIITNKIINKYLDRTCSWLLKNADGLIFQSDISLQMHKKFLNFDEMVKPSCIIHNGVDINKFHPKLYVEQKFGFPSVVISASKFRLHKRLQESIKLINHLSVYYPNIKLNILGEMDLLTNECVKQMDTSRCVFYGKVDPIQLPFYYQNAHIQLHLSIFDPCPNVVVEGLASGLPVITPFESGAKELIGEINLDCAVEESLKLQYMELHRHETIPIINLNEYSIVFKNIFENLRTYQKSARFRAEDALNINTIASQYKEFFIKVRKKLND